MQGALPLKIMAEARLVGIPEGHPTHPGEHHALFDGLSLIEVSSAGS